MLYLSGRVHSIIHESPGKAFYILKMVLDDPSLVDGSDYKSGNVTIRGTIPGMSLKEGSWFGLEAHWTKHKTYGRQLVISRAPVVKASWDVDSAEKAMAANGVGERTLQIIRSTFGDADFLDVLSDPKRIEENTSISPLTAVHVASRWAFVQSYFKVLNFVGDLGLPPAKINQVWAKFGDDAERTLSANPWLLVMIDGITFAQADSIAMRVGLSMDNPNRLKGAVIYAAKNQRSFGHMYLTTGQLMSEVQNIAPDAKHSDFANVLAEGHKENSLVVDRDTREGVRAIYDPWSWRLEQDTATALIKRSLTAAFVDEGRLEYVKRLGDVGPKTEALVKEAPDDLFGAVEAAVDEWGDSTKLVLSAAQREGVINALSAPVSILTGLPGTGKTTCLVAVVSILKDMGIPYLLCAPTGIAAKNLGAKTNALAMTIHRAFSAKGMYDDKRGASYVGLSGGTAGGGDDSGSEKDEEWGYERDYPAKVVIVDEASMLDQHLMYRLLSCTADDCRLVIVGDAAQLPSVGPGNVLRDLIGSDQFPVVPLTEIFRQKDTSGIVYAAHAIHRGELPDTDLKDFKLMSLSKDEEVANTIVKIAVKLYESKENFQVLSPRHNGPVGVTALNARMRELLNPGGMGSQEINIGDSTIREGDRIMVVKNNYKLKVFNGDVGSVVRIDRKNKKVELKIYGDPVLMVEVEFKEIGGLIRLAYACTVHKSQGLEYDWIVMPVVDSFGIQLQRNLLYTAVTRARKRVVLVGSMSALHKAVINDREDLRNTLFKDRLMKPLVGMEVPPEA